MRSLRNLKKSAVEIAQILAQDPTLCKLLVIDAQDALDQATPDVNLNDLISNNYICFFPPVESRIEDYGRNTFITILLDEVSFNNSGYNNVCSIIIYVTTNEDHILLTNNKLRLIEMCDRIAQLLDGTKLSSAGTLSCNTMIHTMLSEFHSAYRMRFTLVDQENERAEI